MSKTKLWLAAAAWVLTFGAGRAQNPALTSHEAELRAKAAAAAEKARPLIEADRRHPRIGGVWLIQDPAAGAGLRTLEGQLPPMTAAGKALVRQRAAAIKAGKSPDPAEVCLPPGTPRVMWSGEPFLITQAPAKITFFHQYRHIVRHVFLDGPLKISEPDPNWQGHSSGYWQGNALVIETGGFNGEEWLDGSGLPQSPDMKVTERLSLVGPDTLEDQVTIDDAKFYARPWTTRVLFKRLPESTNLVEEECSEKLLEFPLKNYQPD
jgi:hypothetical protein